MEIVAVTGAEGFIGSHLVEALVRCGNRVRAMVLYNMFSSTGWLATLDPEVSDQVDVVFGDVRDPATVRELVEGTRPRSTTWPPSGRSPTCTGPRGPSWTPSTIGTLHVLEAVRACETPRMVHTSTSETYGTASVPINESHPLQAQSPYAATKVAADKLVESYYLSFGTPAVTLRPFNTFGPRQLTRAVIPQIITQLASGSPAGSPSGPSPPVTSATSRTPRTRSWTWAQLRRRRLSERYSTPAWARTSPSVSFCRRISPDSWVWTPTSSKTRSGCAPWNSEVMQLVRRLEVGVHPAASSPRDEGLRRAIEWFTQPAEPGPLHRQRVPHMSAGRLAFVATCPVGEPRPGPSR